jgi:hypothetical protein
MTRHAVNWQLDANEDRGIKGEQREQRDAA